MNEVEDKGVAITLGVLAVAGVVLVGAQLRWVSNEKAIMDRQLSMLADRSNAAKNAKKEAEELVQRREEQIKLAKETEVKYAALLSDLLELSKTDPDARQITLKWKIQGPDQTSASGVTPGPVAPGPLAQPEKAPERIPAKAPSGR